MSAVRKEKDSLGFVEVPERAYYGAQTARAVENYPISGMRAHPLLIRAFGMVKRAAAEANKALGLISDKRADAIIQAAQEVIDGKWNDEFVVDVFQAGAGVSLPHEHQRGASPTAPTRFSAASSASMPRCIPTTTSTTGSPPTTSSPPACASAPYSCSRRSTRCWTRWPSTFRQKAAEFDGIMKSGRTHMQDAVPIRLGQEFAAYGVAIEKTKRALLLASDSLRELGLGGSAVGTGINTHPDYREKAIANLAAHLPRRAHARRGHALGHAVECLHGRGERGPPRCRAGGHPHLQRPPPALLRPQYRLRRDLPAQPAARLVHHARQDQSRHAGARRHGQLPGHRQRRRRRPGRARPASSS